MNSSAVRDRILDAATRSFYAAGIRAVSADRLIAEAGVSKVTFYRHFRSKDDLVEAYLSRVAGDERARVAHLRDLHSGDPADVLRAYATAVSVASCSPGFRGCPFINAAAEYADPAHPAHPARRVVEAHRAWLRGQAVDLVRQLGVGEPEPTADILLMLRDGAMISGYLGRAPDEVAERLVEAGRAVLRT